MATKKKTNKKSSRTAEVRESAQKIWLAGLGALSVAETEGTKLFKDLVKKGEGFEKRGKRRASSNGRQGKVEDEGRGRARRRRVGDLGAQGRAPSFDVWKVASRRSTA